jgi:hypothetical protein
MKIRLEALAAAAALCLACASDAKKPASAGGEGGGEETGGSVGSTGGKVGSTGGSGGVMGTGGASGPDAAAARGGAPGNADAGPDVAAAVDLGEQPKFSFFVTSLVAMRRLAKSQDGFGGDLRYGTADGLSGADKICTEIAESVRPGAGAKGWRAFLSASTGPGGMPVHAIDRIGQGPWYDFMGRIVAMNKAALLNARPMGANPAIINDLPNEHGIPNRRPDLSMPAVDNHHVLTGSDTMGRFFSANANCKDWTALTGAGRPRVGLSWPAGGRQHWISQQDEAGCGAGINIRQTGGPDLSNPVVGSGGGYGGIYCFALVP